MFTQMTTSSQVCLPEGITFTTQAEIDSFQTNYPGCTEIEGNVTISGNNITNLNGLNMVNSIGQSLDLSYNDVLTSLNGLDNLTSLKNLSIENNNLLTNLTGLEGLDSIEGFFGITGNSALTNLTGLDNLRYIGGHLVIEFNGALTSLTGLNNLTSIGSLFQLYGNDALTSLTGLEGLTFIGGSLHIYHNNALLNLSGPDNVDGSSIAALYIMNNSSLSSCAAQCICDFFANPQHGDYEIVQNSPGCNSPEEVEAACGVGFSENHPRQDELTIFPNPVSDQTSITFILEHTDNVKLEIVNMMGQIVAAIIDESLSHGEHQVNWNAEKLPSGIYFFRLTTVSQSSTEKMVVVR